MSSSLPPDPYRVLGVSKDAQVAEIRSAHRKLVLKCHPDKVQDPTLKAQKQDEFQKVQQAYELLSDERERQKYDDQVKLADLREQMRKVNLATPRSASKYTEYEIRTPEPRSASYKAANSQAPPSAGKAHAYSRSWDEDVSSGPKIFEPGSRSSRREPSYADSRSKRESERERERDRDAREKEKERERERERRKKSEKEDAIRRAEKEAKEARRADKKLREKQRDKELKRESEEKKKHAKPYIEEYSDEAPPPKSEKKKSSSKKDKYDDKRDRSAHREETPVMPIPIRSFTEYATTPYVDPPRVAAAAAAAPAAAPESTSWHTDIKLNKAAIYIEAARAKEGGLKRSVTYHTRLAQPPAAPTPPPAPSQTSPFAVPDEDDVRRSSARSRRGSSESTRLNREKAYRKSSREPMDEPIILSASPNSRHASHPAMSGSPPHLPRTTTMPADVAYARAVPPGITRAQTFNYGESADPRGRNRSRLQPQIDEEDYDSDDVYEHRNRERKHRNSRRTISPEPPYVETSPRYPPAYDARQAPYSSRRMDPEAERYAAYYSTSHPDRPSMPLRESSYSTSAGSGQFKVKESKMYGYDDVQYSQYQQKPREAYPAYA